MKGRRIPVVIDPPPPPTMGYRQAMDADEVFFRRNPHATEYMRPYVPGECSPDMPPGTKVHVKRLGYRRIRGFAPPSGTEVRN